MSKGLTKYCLLTILLLIGDILIIFSYILLSFQEHDSSVDVQPIIAFDINFSITYRSFYDLSVFLVHFLISCMCCKYLWKS